MVGMETHVCVYQTSVDLSRAGYSLFVLDDAVSSRSLHNYQSGLQALRDAGCTVISTETAIFQLLKVAATPEFKKVVSLIK
jgi:nicotinamidase-related amidase